jgi:hypothetical protein
MSPIKIAPPRSRSSVLRWIAGALGLAAIVTAVAIAVWPSDSAADKARDDGKDLGQAVGKLYYAQNTADVNAATADINSALSDTRDHASDELNKHVDKQADALNRAADGYAGSHTSDNEWDRYVYRSELNYAVDDLKNNADHFQNQRSDVDQAYYEGFRDGLPSALK